MLIDFLFILLSTLTWSPDFSLSYLEKKSVFYCMVLCFKFSLSLKKKKKTLNCMSKKIVALYGFMKV